MGGLKEALESLQADHKKLIEDEEARAKAAEDEIAKKIAAQETSTASAQEELKGMLKGLEAAQAQSASAQEKEAEERAEMSKAAGAALEDQVKALREQQQSDATALQDRCESLEGMMVQKTDATAFKDRCEKIEGLLEYRYAEQKGINDEAYNKDKELSERLDGLVETQTKATTDEAKAKEAGAAEAADAVQKLREELANVRQSSAEAASKAATAAEESESVAKLRGDLQAVEQSSEEFQAEQTKINEEQTKQNETLEKSLQDLHEQSAGFRENLDTTLGNVADLMGRVDGMAEKEEVLKLAARVEGGFDSLLVHIETEKWLKSHSDGVADGITQSFLGLVDQTCEKLAVRVQKIESAISDPGT